MREVDVAWAAGFAEGEGYFGWNGTPRVIMTQVDLWPMQRWMEIFPGGTMKLRPARGKSREHYRWFVSGERAVAVMEELRPLLSPRRQQAIDQAIFNWNALKAERQAKRNDRCPNGHVGFKKERRSKGVVCTECVRIRNRRHYERRREAALNEE